jgi:hypothetical protein
MSFGAGTCAALAFKGIHTIALIVARLTLLFACLALLKLVPRIGRNNPPATSSNRSERSTESLSPYN